MKEATRQGGLLILITFIVAMMLTVMPLPDMLQRIRPEWAALVILYWCMALPQRIGVGIAWMTGLLLDVLSGSLLGQHALSMTVIAYLILNMHQRVRLFPLWQQAVVVWMLLNLYQLLLLWFDGITGQPAKGLLFWLPPLAGMVLWPVVFIVLRKLRRRYRVK